MAADLLALAETAPDPRSLIAAARAILEGMLADAKGDSYTQGTISFTAYSESVHQAIRVDVAGGVLSVIPVHADGTTMDAITITKTP